MVLWFAKLNSCIFVKTPALGVLYQGIKDNPLSDLTNLSTHTIYNDFGTGVLYDGGGGGSLSDPYGTKLFDPLSYGTKHL